MGTPQMRWREMHQSGRVATMLEMRSSPHAGSHVTPLDLVERALAEGGFGSFGESHRRLHGDEPLLGGAEDDGLVAAPAVRVGVFECRGAHQRAALFEQLDDERVGLEDC